MGGEVKLACAWEPIDSFNSLAEYRRFQRWMDDQIASGVASTVAVSKPYSGSELWDEHWYECLEDHRVWRLVGPDPPFRGIFKLVG